MDDILEDLNKLGKSLEEAKKKLSMEEGRLDEMYKSLNSEFNVEGLKQAESKVQEMEKELASLECDIEEGYQDLKEKYDWE